MHWGTKSYCHTIYSIGTTYSMNAESRPYFFHIINNQHFKLIEIKIYRIRKQSDECIILKFIWEYNKKEKIH